MKKLMKKSLGILLVLFRVDYLSRNLFALN
jgi:hypothetical protein